MAAAQPLVLQLPEDDVLFKMRVLHQTHCEEFHIRLINTACRSASAGFGVDECGLRRKMACELRAQRVQQGRLGGAPAK